MAKKFSTEAECFLHEKKGGVWDPSSLDYVRREMAICEDCDLWISRRLGVEQKRMDGWEREPGEDG